MYIILSSSKSPYSFEYHFSSFFLPFVIITAFDWKKQHKEFHKELRLTHPVQQRSANENQLSFSWPRNIEFLGVKHDQRQDIIGKMGEILTVAPVYPVDGSMTDLTWNKL